MFSEINLISFCYTASLTGLALAASFAIRYSQIHQTYLLKNMSVYNPVFNQRFIALKHFFMQNHATVTAMKQANVVLYKQLLVQAKLCPFADIYQLVALITFLVIPLAFILKLIPENK
ncbi:MAG: hypothetical protein ACI4SM_06160 [Candidatus Gastranaerophilaceae bacterium]